MKELSLSRITAVALLALGAAACDDSTSAPALISEQELTTDLAAEAGEAIVSDIQLMVGNESFAGFSVTPGFNLSEPADVVVNRTRTCFDAQGNAQQQCDPNTTASVQLTVSRDGTFSRSHEGPRGTEELSGSVHQARTLTISGLAGQETSRTHNGTGTSRDTVDFTGVHDGVTLTRHVTTASDDTVSSVVFNLPHSQNPWPVSGTIVRNASGTITISVSGGANDRSETRSWQRRTSVTFPADAQGNVTVQINDKTCNLNLVTRRVTNCS